MTIAFWCVLVAAIVPFMLAGVSKIGDSSFNNRRPRDWYESVTGYRKRAWWAQQNSFEALPFFAAAVIIAHVAGATQGTIDIIAILFIAARLAFASCYLADLHLLRSVFWILGLACCVALFIVAA
ncbi:MAG: MAPEG family protein [Wenzhouxiangella sp.]|nr:MAPEG family protein [Wenzhouxiangella sp.]